MAYAAKFEDPLLPFPTRCIEAAWGPLQEYLIPDRMKKDVLRLLYPFVPVPSLEQRMLDIHENKRFVVRDFRVFRQGSMNVLASPYYPNSGGTVIDWWDED